MNIFLLDKDLKKSAEYLDDVHLNKQILELVQMLYLCLYPHEKKCYYSFIHWKIHKLQNYKNNRVFSWVKLDKATSNFTIKYLHELLKEYEYRKEKLHKCVIDYEIIRNSFDYPLLNDECESFIYAESGNEPIYYENLANVVDLYRDYWCRNKLHDKNGTAYRYTKRETPYFVLKYLKAIEMKKGDYCNLILGSPVHYKTVSFYNEHHIDKNLFILECTLHKKDGLPFVYCRMNLPCKSCKYFISINKKESYVVCTFEGN